MFQSIRLPSGEKLALDVVPPRGAVDFGGGCRPAATTAVYVHGLGSHRGGEKALFFEQEFVARGCGFARFDLRGHGESDSTFEQLTLTRQLEDLSAVLSHLASGAAGAPPERALLIGSSLGALTVAWHTAVAGSAASGSLPVLAQVLIAPAFRIVERFLGALGEFGRERWKREGVYRFVGPWFEFDLRWDVVAESERYPHARLLEAKRPPTLVLHGTRDESAPFRLSVEYVAGCKGQRPKLVAIEGGDHRLSAWKARLLDEILGFLRTDCGIGEGEFACKP